MSEPCRRKPPLCCRSTTVFLPRPQQPIRNLRFEGSRRVQHSCNTSSSVTLYLPPRSPTCTLSLCRPCLLTSVCPLPPRARLAVESRECELSAGVRAPLWTSQSNPAALRRVMRRTIRDVDVMRRSRVCTHEASELKSQRDAPVKQIKRTQLSESSVKRSHN